jgi:hypothetical protein
MIDYDTLPNPGPAEADRMPRLDLETVLNNLAFDHPCAPACARPSAVDLVR